MCNKMKIHKIASVLFFTLLSFTMTIIIPGYGLISPLIAYAEDQITDAPEKSHSDKNSMVSESIFATPEMFGAVGDGKHDDTTAIQQAIDSGLPILLLPKRYYTTSTITIQGNVNITDLGSVILYDGSDSAIRFSQINNNCDVSFGIISAENGNGIEFFCDSRESHCQYINLNFHSIQAKHCCIFFNRSGSGDVYENGWLNEIRISDGRFQSGRYGIYADAKHCNSINNIKLINVAFEGVKIGARMANGCRGWSFINPRIAEMIGEDQILFETVESMVGLNILSNDRFKIGKCSFSSETQGAVIAPIAGADSWNSSGVVGNIGEIINGVLYPYDQSTVSLRHFIEIPKSMDLNTVIRPGNYCCTDQAIAETIQNAPTNIPFTMTVSYGNGTVSYMKQELKTNIDNTCYSRTCIVQSGTFSEWKRMLNEDDYEALHNEIEELRELIAQSKSS